MHSSFNLNRIGLLGRKEFYESFLPHFKIMTIVISAIILIRCVVEYFETPNGTVNNFNYVGVFIVFGFIYTINSFRELKLLPTRADFLTLPATTAEKVFTKWLFHVVLYWIGVAILFTVFYFIQKMIIGGMMHKPYESYDIFSKTNVTGLHFILIIFSVYFFGAATYNTGAWYKVILWGIIISLVYLFILMLFAYSLFPELRAAVRGEIHNTNVELPLDVMLEDFWVFKFSKFFILYLAAPFFWFMTYLKIKEKEV
jgi:hypothetical protein